MTGHVTNCNAAPCKVVLELGACGCGPIARAAVAVYGKAVGAAVLSLYLRIKDGTVGTLAARYVIAADAVCPLSGGGNAHPLTRQVADCVYKREDATARVVKVAAAVVVALPLGLPLYEMTERSHGRCHYAAYGYHRGDNTKDDNKGQCPFHSLHVKKILSLCIYSFTQKN